MTRRRLTQEEIALWRSVADRAERLRPEGAPSERPMPKPKPVKPVAPRAEPFWNPTMRPEPRIAMDLKPNLQDRLKAAPLQMDHKVHRRMKRGKLVPEDRIDLHGMTLDRAHPVLIRFILSAQASGLRLVLVITGKGRKGRDDGLMPVPQGILKHHVPQWLATPPLAQAVLQVTEAHTSHGGGGAYYVYLKRSR